MEEVGSDEVRETTMLESKNMESLPVSLKELKSCEEDDIPTIQGKGLLLFIGSIEAILCLMLLAGCMTGNGSGSPAMIGNPLDHVTTKAQLATKSAGLVFRPRYVGQRFFSGGRGGLASHLTQLATAQPGCLVPFCAGAVYCGACRSTRRE